jgi:F-type H+-transporting ATPase subunit delta
MSSDDNVIAVRYARALFELASENKQHDSIKKDMVTLQSVLTESIELQKLLVSPVITREQAEKTMAAILTAIKAGDLTKKFFALLARERRLGLTSIMIQKYLTMLAESVGEITVEVTSATKLDIAELELMKKTLSKTTGKKVELQTKENPALIGGVQIRIGSQMLDNSIAGKLSRLRQALQKAA